MKTTLIAVGLALSLLGATTTAEAQSFRGGRDDGFRNNGRHEVIRDRDFGRHWNRGDRFSGRHVVVNNWNRYNLRRPPRGYHWVRHNNDFLLAAIASGLIADIIINSGGYGGGYNGGYGYGY